MLFLRKTLVHLLFCLLVSSLHLEEHHENNACRIFLLSYPPARYKVDCSHNRWRTLPTFDFDDRVTELDLHGSKHLENIDERSVKNLTKLEVLLLHDSGLQTLPQAFLQRNAKTLRVLSLGNNNIPCDCSISWIWMELINEKKVFSKDLIGFHRGLKRDELSYNDIVYPPLTCLHPVTKRRFKIDKLDLYHCKTRVKRDLDEDEYLPGDRVAGEDVQLLDADHQTDVEELLDVEEQTDAEIMEGLSDCEKFRISTYALASVMSVLLLVFFVLSCKRKYQKWKTELSSDYQMEDVESRNYENKAFASSSSTVVEKPKTENTTECPADDKKHNISNNSQDMFFQRSSNIYNTIPSLIDGMDDQSANHVTAIEMESFDDSPPCELIIEPTNSDRTVYENTSAMECSTYEGDANTLDRVHQLKQQIENCYESIIHKFEKRSSEYSQLEPETNKLCREIEDGDSLSAQYKELNSRNSEEEHSEDTGTTALSSSSSEMEDENKHGKNPISKERLTFELNESIATVDGGRMKGEETNPNFPRNEIIVQIENIDSSSSDRSSSSFHELDPNLLTVPKYDSDESYSSSDQISTPSMSGSEEERYNSSDGESVIVSSMDVEGEGQTDHYETNRNIEVEQNYEENYTYEDYQQNPERSLETYESFDAYEDNRHEEGLDAYEDLQQNSELSLENSNDNVYEDQQRNPEQSLETSEDSQQIAEQSFDAYEDYQKSEQSFGVDDKANILPPQYSRDAGYIDIRRVNSELSDDGEDAIYSQESSYTYDTPGDGQYVDFSSNNDNMEKNEEVEMKQYSEAHMKQQRSQAPLSEGSTNDFGINDTNPLDSVTVQHSTFHRAVSISNNSFLHDNLSLQDPKDGSGDNEFGVVSVQKLNQHRTFSISITDNELDSKLLEGIPVGNEYHPGMIDDLKNDTETNAVPVQSLAQAISNSSKSKDSVDSLSESNFRNTYLNHSKVGDMENGEIDNNSYNGMVSVQQLNPQRTISISSENNDSVSLSRRNSENDSFNDAEIDDIRDNEIDNSYNGIVSVQKLNQKRTISISSQSNDSVKTLSESNSKNDSSNHAEVEDEEIREIDNSSYNGIVSIQQLNQQRTFSVSSQSNDSVETLSERISENDSFIDAEIDDIRDNEIDNNSYNGIVSVQKLNQKRTISISSQSNDSVKTLSESNSKNDSSNHTEVEDEEIREIDNNSYNGIVSIQQLNQQRTFSVSSQSNDSVENLSENIIKNSYLNHATVSDTESGEIDNNSYNENVSVQQLNQQRTISISSQSNKSVDSSSEIHSLAIRRNISKDDFKNGETNIHNGNVSVQQLIQQRTISINSNSRDSFDDLSVKNEGSIDDFSEITSISDDNESTVSVQQPNVNRSISISNDNAIEQIDLEEIQTDKTPNSFCKETGNEKILINSSVNGLYSECSAENTIGVQPATYHRAISMTYPISTKESSLEIKNSKKNIQKTDTFDYADVPNNRLVIHDTRSNTTNENQEADRSFKSLTNIDVLSNQQLDLFASDGNSTNKIIGQLTSSTGKKSSIPVLKKSFDKIIGQSTSSTGKTSSIPVLQKSFDRSIVVIKKRSVDRSNTFSMETNKETNKLIDKTSSKSGSLKSGTTSNIQSNIEQFSNNKSNTGNDISVSSSTMNSSKSSHSDGVSRPPFNRSATFIKEDGEILSKKDSFKSTVASKDTLDTFETEKSLNRSNTFSKENEVGIDDVHGNTIKSTPSTKTNQFASKRSSFQRSFAFLDESSQSTPDKLGKTSLKSENPFSSENACHNNTSIDNNHVQNSPLAAKRASIQRSMAVHFGNHYIDPSEALEYEKRDVSRKNVSLKELIDSKKLLQDKSVDEESLVIQAENMTIFGPDNKSLFIGNPDSFDSDRSADSDDYGAIHQEFVEQPSLDRSTTDESSCIGSKQPNDSICDSEENKEINQGDFFVNHLQNNKDGSRDSAVNIQPSSFHRSISISSDSSNLGNVIKDDDLVETEIQNNSHISVNVQPIRKQRSMTFPFENSIVDHHGNDDTVGKIVETHQKWFDTVCRSEKENSNSVEDLDDENITETDAQNSNAVTIQKAPIHRSISISQNSASEGLDMPEKESQCFENVGAIIKRQSVVIDHSVIRISNGRMTDDSLDSIKKDSLDSEPTDIVNNSNIRIDSISVSKNFSAGKVVIEPVLKNTTKTNSSQSLLNMRTNDHEKVVNEESDAENSKNGVTVQPSRPWRSMSISSQDSEGELSSSNNEMLDQNHIQNQVSVQTAPIHKQRSISSSYDIDGIKRNEEDALESGGGAILNHYGNKNEQQQSNSVSVQRRPSYSKSLSVSTESSRSISDNESSSSRSSISGSTESGNNNLLAAGRSATSNNEDELKAGIEETIRTTKQIDDIPNHQRRESQQERFDRLKRQLTTLSGNVDNAMKRKNDLQNSDISVVNETSERTTDTSSASIRTDDDVSIRTVADLSSIDGLSESLDNNEESLSNVVDLSSINDSVSTLGDFSNIENSLSFKSVTSTVLTDFEIDDDELSTTTSKSDGSAIKSYTSATKSKPATFTRKNQEIDKNDGESLAGSSSLVPNSEGKSYDRMRKERTERLEKLKARLNSLNGAVDGALNLNVSHDEN